MRIHELDPAVAQAHAEEVALVAAHPYSQDHLVAATRATEAFGAQPELVRLEDELRVAA